MENASLQIRKGRFATAIIFIFVMAIVCIPLFLQRSPIGYDWKFHMLRMEGIRNGLLSGQFPVRIYPSFYNGYGYAVPLFYPDLFLYIPAVFMVLGLSVVTSYRIFIITISVACFWSTYYCAKGISKSNYTALITSVVYSLAQYHLQCIYLRIDIGDVLSFVFLPFIVYGLYNFIFEEFDKPQLFIVGFTGLIYSHVISTFLALAICVIVCLFSLFRILKNPKKLTTLLLSAVTVLCLTCAFWAPMLEQFTTDKFLLHIEPVGTLPEMAVHFSNLFFGYAVIGGTCCLGGAIFLLCLLRFFIPKDTKPTALKKMDWFLMIGLFLSFASTKLFPWGIVQKLLPVVSGIQFPWRLYSFAVLFLSLAIGMICEAKYREKQRRIGLELVTILMGFTAIFVLIASASFGMQLKNYYYNIVDTYPANGYEYIHSGLSKDLIYDYTSGTPEVANESGEKLPFIKNGIKVIVDYNQSSDYIDLPLLYYKGYAAIYTNQDGTTQNLSVSYTPDRYTVRVNCSKIQGSGIITVDYPGTFIQHFSLAVSTISLISILFYWELSRRRSASQQT